jgi:hypothetical protein
MWKTMGEELNAWNVETMHYINEAFFNFWPVDIFNFCSYFQCTTDTDSRGFIINSAIYPYLDSRGLLQVRERTSPRLFTRATTPDCDMFRKMGKRATFLSKQIRYEPFTKVKQLYVSNPSLPLGRLFLKSSYSTRGIWDIPLPQICSRSSGQ